MSSQPLVTVLLPAYNHERYIEQSIRSVIAQDYPNIELIVLNDGSKDRTAEVIRSLDAECRARFVRYEFVDKPNEGVARTMNRGLEWARAEFISGIASDDLMKPDKISTLMAVLYEAPPEVGLAGGDADFVDDDGRLIGLDADKQPVSPEKGVASFLELHIRNRRDVDPQRNFFSYETLIRGNYVPALSMLWRRSALEKVGGWTPGMAIEDWDIWLVMARHYQCIYVPRVLASYRWHASNAIKTAGVSMRQGVDRIYEREFPYLRNDPALARFVARKWLQNSRRLSRLGHREYLRRYLRVDILLAALGLAPLGMPRPVDGN